MKEIINKAFNIVGMIILAPLALLVVAAGYCAAPFAWIVGKLFPDDKDPYPANKFLHK